MNHLEVSVVIPTYNSEEYIAQALKSVFNQTYQNFEVILVDDASTDHTVSIAQSFADKRLKIIKSGLNRGVSHSRNLGIAQARGKWIALLDSDDWYDTERLEKLLAVAEQQDADMIADDLLLMREDESQPWSTFLTEDSHQSSSSSVTLIDAVKFVASDRLRPINAKRNWSLGYVKPLIKREFLIQNNIRYDEKVKVGEDFILYLECLKQGAKFYLVSQAYYYYRTRNASLSCRTQLEFLAESCEITQRFINLEVRTHAECRLLQALLQNLSIFQKRRDYYYVIEHLKNKELLAVTKRLIDSPYVLGNLFQKVIAILVSKLVSMFTLKQSDYAKRSPKRNQVAYSER